MKKRILCALLAVMLLMAAGGCASQSAPSAPPASAPPAGGQSGGQTKSVSDAKLGISINSLDSSSNYAEYEMCIMFGEQAGFEVIATNAQGYASAQATDIENLAAQGCDVIIVLNGDTAGLTNVVQDAVARGSKVISLETGWIDGISCMFEKGDFALGSDLYIRMAAMMGFEGEVITTGHNDHPAIRVRTRVQTAVLDEFSGITRVNHVYTTYPGTQEITYSGVETALQANPNVKAIWTTQDLEALGALEACKALGRDDIIICAEGVDEAVLSLIAEGSNIKLTVVCDLEDACRKAVEVAADIVLGNPIEPWYEIRRDVVTQENAAEFLAKAREMNELFENR